MRYPEFLKQGDTIGLVAPSFGVCGYPYQDRYESARRAFLEKGYKLKECASVHNLEHARSNSAKVRAREFMDMYLDEEVDFIMSVAGGELMLEILPYIDFEKLRKSKPKYFMGLSDNTCLTFTLPLLTDTAAIYGPNFGSFGMEKWDRSTKESYEIMTGKRHKQKSFPKYESDNSAEVELNPLCGYKLTEKVVYESLDGQDCQMQGRLIGGCLDIIVSMIGTPYCDWKPFMEKYRSDGIIWFLEACDLNVLDISRALWSMRNAGLFEGCTGIFMGRAKNPEPLFDVDVREAIEANVGDLNIPVIFDGDIGHVAPIWTLISGSMATIRKEGKKGSIELELK